MDVIDMVRRQLVALGADGLANPGQNCGCGLEDLFPCGNPHETECVSARRRERIPVSATCSACDAGPDCMGHCYVPMAEDEE